MSGQRDSRAEVEVIITPSEGQYRQLVEDLETLRDQGAQSNTEAILAAVRLAAEREGE
jgi:hypothetical protein